MDERILVLGTHNQKKRDELQQLLGPRGFQLRTLADFPDVRTVAETGTTFAENAALKACQQARHLGHFVLGEDSGLCVDALDGAPGVFSARFAGTGSDDEANNRLLLERLGDTPLERRTAHYVCHIAVSDPQGRVVAESEAVCRGRIGFQPRGTNGFGYDPLFIVVEYHRTFGQLGPAIKAALSHRARAIARLLPPLLRAARHGGWQTAR